MPRLRPLAVDEVDAAIRPVFEAFMKQRGNIPNLFATTGRAPGFTRALHRLLLEASAPGEVSTRLKELIAIRISLANQCHY